MDPNTSDRRELLKSALVRIDQLEKRLAAAESRQHDPIAVIGVSCRFPGKANSPDAFWALLRDGVDAITDIPTTRWNLDDVYDPDPDASGKMYARGGGFIDDVDRFDPQFFGIAPREAPYMDPQQRLLLETTWEALEHAGIAPGSLSGSATGVFIGLTAHDYARLQTTGEGFEYIDTYFGTGVAGSIAAGRLSYVLGLRGPAVTVDTACSSSLVAIHLACQSLRNGETRLAVAGGANLILTPEGHVIASKGRMLAPDSRCKTFDARADGYVRSEGCGVVALKRLADALSDGDPVLAVIRGTALNQDGRSGGLTAPSGRAQEDVMRRALADGGISPREVVYVEAHGTGTSLGDPIEVQALGSVQAAGRPADDPLLIGSVKTNVGHLEAAAGVAGVIKAVLALHHGQIPGHLHFEKPNPFIPWAQLPIEVATALRPWPKDRRRIIGVSSFGFSGTNAHLVLEAAPERERAKAVHERPAHLLVISGRTRTALDKATLQMSGVLEHCPPEQVGDVCFTSAVGRSHFEHRLAVVGASAAELRDAVRSHLDGQQPQGVMCGEASLKRVPEVAFLFTGQGSQYAGMGRELYDSSPAFRAALDRCDAILTPRLGRSLVGVLYPPPGGESDSEALLAQTAWTQPALFAIEYALAELWQAWGVRPSMVMGHSVGEYVAACVAGVFSLEDGLALIAERARLMQGLPEGGAMAALPVDEATVRKALGPFADRVAIAAVNAPSQTVISGAQDGVDSVIAALGGGAAKAQRLRVSHAFHSPLLAPMLKPFERFAASIAIHPAQVPLISNLTGRFVDEGARLDSVYWRRHAESAVRFFDSLETARGAGHRILVEIGPAPTLTALGSRSMPDQDVRWIPSLRRGSSDWRNLLTALGILYVEGVPVDWAAFDRAFSRTRMHLPTYPFQRQQYWVSAPPARKVRHRQQPDGHPLLGRRLSSPSLVDTVFEVELDAEGPRAVADHRVFGRVIVPAAAYLEVAASAATSALGDPCVIEDLVIHEPIILDEGATRTMQTIVRAEPHGHVVEIHSRAGVVGDRGETWQLHAAARARVSREESGTTWAHEGGDLLTPVEPEAYYARLTAAGVEYGPAFRSLTSIARRDGRAVAELRVPAEALGEAQSYGLHPGILDACFQALGLALPGGLEAADGDRVYLPVQADQYQRVRDPRPVMRVEARIESDGGTGETFVGSVRLEDPDGSTVASVTGLRFKRASRAAMQRATTRSADEWMHEIDWQSAAAVESKPLEGLWILFADAQGTMARVAAALQGRNVTSLLVRPGDRYSWEGRGEATIRAAVPDDYLALVAAASERGPIAGVVHGWNLDLGGDQAPTRRDLGVTSVLHVVQALTARRMTAPLTILTCGSQPAGATSKGPSVAQASTIGLGRTVASEHPELRVVLVDLDAQLSNETVALLSHELRSDRTETEVALRGGERYVPRLVRTGARMVGTLQSPARGAFGLEIPQRGVLENLELKTIDIQVPGPGQVRIRVNASGLNFRDVLNTLGMYPGDPGHLGGEVVGVIDAIGEGVTRFKPGDQVLALTPRAFCSVVVTAEPLVWLRPPSMTVTEAATIPMVFQTAHYALNHLAHMKAGERVLIHAGAGGVGLAAIQLAQLAGAEIFATAGSAEKRAWLRSLGVQHVMDSRSLAFADDITAATRGEGIDIVLNSLAGEFIPRSLALLRQGGRFLELGKTDLWDEDRARAVNPKASYAAVYLGDVCVTNPAAIATMFGELMAEFAGGSLRPLPHRVWPIDRAIDAFRFMAQARHIGKVVIEQRTAADQPLVAQDGAYLVTGGFGGLGLTVAEWLVDRGAGHVALLGRREPDPASRQAVERMEARGATVSIHSADVADFPAMQGVFAALDATGSRLRGIVHAAGVLDDGMLVQQNASRFEAVMRPKVDGAWNLHRLTADRDLDFFVLFSAGAALFGAPGQGNYAAANTALDALAWLRRSAGLTGLSINWGPWREVGMAARLGAPARERWEAQGVGALTPAQGLAAFEWSLRTDRSQVAVLPMEWRTFLAQWKRGSEPPLLRALARDVSTATPAPGTDAVQQAVVEQLNALPSEDRRSFLESHVREQVARVLAIDPGTLRGDRGFTDLGMDSLMSVELSNRLTRSLKRQMPATLAFEQPNLDALIGFLAGLLGIDAPESTVSAAPDDGERAALLQDVERLSDSEAEASLARELDSAGY